MTLPQSGKISIMNLALEFDDTHPSSLSEFYGDGNGPASGTVKLSDYYSTNSTSRTTSGLLFELDARDSSSYGGSGTTWSDLTANNRDFSLINGPEGGLPLNINAAVDFSSSSSNTLQDTGNALNLGTGDFTVECYVYHTSIAQNDLQTIFQSTAQANTNNFAFAVESDRIVAGIWAGTFSNATKVEGTFPVGTIKTHRWYHYAACRSSGVLRLFINGDLIVTDSSHTENYNNTSQYGCRVGNNSNNGALAGGTKSIEGYMSNMRVTTSALYTSAFTPPTGTLTNIANTVLLCCKSAANPRTAEVLPGNSSGGTMDEFGTLSATSVIPANGIDFDGTNDYAQIADATWIREGNQAFTAEAYVKIDSFAYGSHNGNDRFLFSKSSVSNEAFALGFKQTSSTQLYMIATTQGSGNVDGDVHRYDMGNQTSWTSVYHHFVWTYDGDALKFYIDGNLEATFTGRTFGNNSAPMRLMALDPNNGAWGLWLDGKASVFRYYNDELTAAEVTTNYINCTGIAAPTVSTLTVTPTTHQNSAFTATFQFNERVADFTTDDITVTNATKGTFTAVDRDTYTLALTPSGTSDINVQVPTTASFNAGNLGNNAINQTITYTP